MSYGSRSKTLTPELLENLDNGHTVHARWDANTRSKVYYTRENAWNNAGIGENTLIVKAAGNYRDTCKVNERCDISTVKLTKSDISDQVLIVSTLGRTKAGVNKDNFVIDTVGESYGARNWIVGTSGATAKVSGKAALIKSKFRDVTGAQLADIIKNTADDLGAPGVDEIYGHGRVNLSRALSPIGSLR